MIKQADVTKKTMHFNAPFEIAYEKVEEAEIVVVKIVTDKDLIGLGSAAPDTEVTGETIESVQSILQKVLQPDFFAEPVDSWYRYHHKIRQAFDGFPSAQAAVEDAILSVWSQENKIPLPVFFGGFRKECPIMITVGIKDDKSMEEDIKKRLTEGFRTIKLKCGLNVADDIKRIQFARSLIPEDRHLILDANQGYSLADAEKLLKAIGPLPIDLIEQPISAKDWEGLKHLHQTSAIPIVADESVVSVNDAFDLLTKDYVAGVNVKLMKCGGPINFMQIFHLAKRLKKIIMLGCMYESQISMTTGGNLALGLPVDFVDLDSGTLDFEDDPATGGAEVRNGLLSIPSPIRLK